MIRQRPDAAEREALLTELDKRFFDYGHRCGWMDRNDGENQSNIITHYIVEKMITWKGPQDKLVSEFKKDVDGLVRKGLNPKGNSGLTFIQLLYKLAKADNKHDAFKVLMDASLGGLGVAASKKYAAVINSMKWVGMSPQVRNKLIKSIAATLLWKNVRLAPALARLNPIATLILTVFTPVRIGDDHYQIFMLFYGKVKAEKKKLFDDVVTSTHTPLWRYRMAPIEALKRHDGSDSLDAGASGNGTIMRAR